MASLGLDLAAGARLAAAEMYGDWYRDPWGWPELTEAAVARFDVQADLGVRASNGGEYHLTTRPFFHPIEVPKSQLGLRPAVVQDAVSRLAYLSAVHSGLTKLNASLPDWVYGWRLRQGDAVAIGRTEWPAYVESLPSSDQAGFGLITDITSFFASIRPDRLEQIIYGLLGKVTPAHIIMDVVRAHDSMSTRGGLPQRSFASAVLAHAILQPIDDALSAAMLTPGITAVRRWMDDISAEGDEGQLFALLMDLQERARQVGLELNASKTQLAPVSETASSLRLEDLKRIRVPWSLVLGDTYEDPSFEPDLELVGRLEDAVLGSPAEAPRPVARAVLVTLTENQQFARCEEWRRAARHLPHAADSLGRYFRGAAEQDDTLWPELGDWFNEYQSTVWGRLDWVVSQYALVFPTTHLPAPVLATLQDWLTNSSSVHRLAVAVQRICTVAPTVGRNIIRGRVDRTADPLLLRLFALGLLLANESRPAVETVLATDQRNWLLHKHLQQTNWRAPSVANDFDLTVAESEE